MFAAKSTVYAALSTEKVNILIKQCFIGIIKCFAVSTVTTRVRMLFIGMNTAPQSFFQSFIALPMTRCSKSALKSAVQVCQVATVVMEITQLVPSQFKNVLSYSMEN